MAIEFNVDSLLDAYLERSAIMSKLLDIYGDSLEAGMSDIVDTIPDETLDESVGLLIAQFFVNHPSRGEAADYALFMQSMVMMPNNVAEMIIEFCAKHPHQS